MEFTWSRRQKEKTRQAAARALLLSRTSGPPPSQSPAGCSLPPLGRSTGSAHSPTSASPQLSLELPPGIALRDVGATLGASASEPALTRRRWGSGSQDWKRDARGFMQRQRVHSTSQSYKKLSVEQREALRDGKAKTHELFHGAHGPEGFRRFLVRKYGSVLAGWRALDRDGAGRLCFQEFCHSCEGIGYHGNVRQLWRELQKKDHVSLNEVDARVGLYVGTFKVTLKEKYGDILTAWREAIDEDGQGGVRRDDFVACCKRLGLDLDAKELFCMFTCNPPGEGSKVTLADLDPASWLRFAAGAAAGAGGARDAG